MISLHSHACGKPLCYDAKRFAWERNAVLRANVVAGVSQMLAEAHPAGIRPAHEYEGDKI
jgi:hypothetical protein